MKEPFISIVIPVYNAAEYLPACLDSLLAQSFTDWEAICVNDGSKDGSLTILQQYAAKDARIRVIDKPNGGVSTARNAALDAACGQYLCMVDADDELPPEALARLTAPLQQQGTLDFVTGGMVWYHHKNGEVTQEVRPPLTYHARQTGAVKSLPLLMKHVSGLPSGKLYRRAVVEAAHLRYNPAVRIGEDQDFTLHFLLHIESAYVVEGDVYHYMIRSNSAMSGFNKGKLPLHDYLAFAEGHLRLLRLLPAEWPAEERKAAAEALLFFYWRNLYRGIRAIARAPKWMNSPTHKWRCAKLILWSRANRLLLCCCRLHGATHAAAKKQLRELEPTLCEEMAFYVEKYVKAEIRRAVLSRLTRPYKWLRGKK